MRILIAEDDQVLADGLLRTLRASGAAVDHVASGSEADAALMTNNEFDLLILDLGLPKMHGLEVLKKLRARGSSLPVLILTAADSVEERVKGLDYGADDYMAKPFSLHELEARVRALTRRGMGGASSTIKHGPLVYDQAGRVARIAINLPGWLDVPLAEDLLRQARRSGIEAPAVCNAAREHLDFFARRLPDADEAAWVDAMFPVPGSLAGYLEGRRLDIIFACTRLRI